MDAATAVIKTINTAPSIVAKIFTGLVTKIFTDTSSDAGDKIFTGAFYDVGDKIFTGAFPHVSDEIFSRPNYQGRQINRPDHSNRRRASK